MKPIGPRGTATDDASWGDALAESVGDADPNRYDANDPSTGAEISLRRLSDGRLFADQATEPYVTSGDFVTFALSAPDRRGRL